jgi:prolyl oligopeptidase PreP (S9A serine peptidase family)
MRFCNHRRRLRAFPVAPHVGAAAGFAYPTSACSLGRADEPPNGFRDLLALSAYDHVVPAAYPATILTTGRDDRRVAPWQVAKMAARLQASTTSGKPILLRADVQGHGLIRAVSAQDDEYADVFSFMLRQMGEPGFVAP